MKNPNSPVVISMTMTEREYAHILAALRLLGDDEFPEHLLDIATDGGVWPEMSQVELDVLSERWTCR